MLMGLMVGIMILFPYCYFGKLATESFEKMFDCTYDLSWPDLPLEQQKSVILMLANMQRPIYYHGFKIATLDLNTFILVSVSINISITINIRNTLFKN